MQRYFDHRVGLGQNLQNDIDIVQIFRRLVRGDNPDLNYNAFGVPLLVAIFLLGEFSRNYMSIYSTLILLDFIESQVTYGNGKHYSWHKVLWHTKEVDDDVFNAYGTSLDFSRWGGKHSMTHQDSFTEQKKDKHGRVIQYDLSWPLSTSRQKEGSLIIRWLHYQLLKNNANLQPEIESHSLSDRACLPTRLPITHGEQMTADQGNPNLMRYLQIYHQGIGDKLNHKQLRQVQNHFYTQACLDAAEKLIKPLLRTRLQSINLM